MKNLRAASVREMLPRDVASGARIVLLLDYDGTLVPLADTPDAATPGRDLLALLTALARLPRCDVHIVSGRSRADLDKWFSEVGVTLWAEHGFWRRPAGRVRWRAARPVAAAWKKELLPLFERACALVPGSCIEQKTVSAAWHYRLAGARATTRRLADVRATLWGAVRGRGLEVIEGHKVIEVRPAGVSKAVVARTVAALDGGVVLAFGDDWTDDDLFAALPPSSITVSVGRALPHARYRLRGPDAVQRILRRVIESRVGLRVTQPPH